MYPKDEKMRKLYEEEREKLTPLPCADSDIEAFEKAWKRWLEEKAIMNSTTKNRLNGYKTVF